MTVTVKMLVDRLKLKVVYGNKELLAKPITTADISRPGLEMTGYFDYYSPERIQLVGMKEWSYLKTLTDHNRYSVFKNMFKEETPAVIVARGLDIPEELYRAAKENGVVVLQGRNGTSSLSGDMSWYLNAQLAERTSVHGVLVDIYGMGVLIQGDSGIGKSETGLELVKRGHRLVADDRVDVYAKDEETLWGEPAEILRHLLEIRGVGIIDVMSLTELVLSVIPLKFSWLFILIILKMARSLTVLEMAMKKLNCRALRFHVSAFLLRQDVTFQSLSKLQQ